MNTGAVHAAIALKSWSLRPMGMRHRNVLLAAVRRHAGSCPRFLADQAAPGRAWGAVCLQAVRLLEDFPEPKIAEQPCVVKSTEV